jgi:hypothetical protein
MKTLRKQEKTRVKKNKPKRNSVQQSVPPYPAESYEILVQGQLDSLWGQWFEGMTLSNVENGESGVACTMISGPVADQPALHGLLIKIRDLNLKLLSVRRIKAGTKKAEEIQVNLELSGGENDQH